MKDQIISIQPTSAPSVKLNADACCDVDHSEHEHFESETGKWDKVGLFLSGLCAVHCLATPLLVLFLPFLGEFFHSEWAHILLALFVVPVGFFAFWSGYKHHHQVKVLVLGIVGMGLIVAASLLPHDWIEVYEFDIVTIAGSILLIAAHLMNRRACLCHKHA